MNKNELFETINNQILEKLNEGVIPWKKSWKEGIPSNFISKRAYHGINFLSLSMKDFPSPYYLTFNQCRERGGSIKAGSKSQMIVYWKVLEYRRDEMDEDITRYPYIRYSNVFNLSQTTLDNIEEGGKVEILECEKLLAGMKEKPEIRHNISRCYYAPNEDYISIPKLVDFDSPDEYYSSLFHELGHWTGTLGRTGRHKKTGYEEDSYCYEELVSELFGSYVCALCGISPNVISNQSAYIQGWLRLSKEKELLFAQASVDAQKAVSLILGN